MWYTIKSSEDWLSKIAKTYLGDAMKYPMIYEANKDIIGPNPDVVKVGMTIWIPIDGKPRPSVTPTEAAQAAAQTTASGIATKAPFKMNTNTMMIVAGGLLGAAALYMLFAKKPAAQT